LSALGKSKEDLSVVDPIHPLTLFTIHVDSPFDIGDRIIIANSPGLPSAGVGDSWFVQGKYIWIMSVVPMVDTVDLTFVLDFSIFRYLPI
jgi:hypothetical protein